MPLLAIEKTHGKNRQSTGVGAASNRRQRGQTCDAEDTADMRRRGQTCGRERLGKAPVAGVVSNRNERSTTEDGEKERARGA